MRLVQPLVVCSLEDIVYLSQKGKLHKLQEIHGKKRFLVNHFSVVFLILFGTHGNFELKNQHYSVAPSKHTWCTFGIYQIWPHRFHVSCLHRHWGIQGEAREARFPLGPFFFFIFMQFLGKIGRWFSTFAVGTPPLGNPGSATDPLR